MEKNFEVRKDGKSVLSLQLDYVGDGSNFYEVIKASLMKELDEYLRLSLGSASISKVIISMDKR